MSFWNAVRAVIGKDVLIELRSRQTLSAMLTFALMTTIIFSFAFELELQSMQGVLPGVLWVAFAFAGLLGLNRSFGVEQEGNCLEGLLLTPVDRTAIYVGKLIANVVIMLLSEALMLPLFAVLLQLPLLLPSLWAVALLGTLGLAVLGTLLAAMVVSTRARDVLLPILLLPLTVPALIAATKSTAFILDARPLVELRPWLQLLIAFDIISIVVALLSFEYVIEE